MLFQDLDHYPKNHTLSALLKQLLLSAWSLQYPFGLRSITHYPSRRAFAYHATNDKLQSYEQRPDVPESNKSNLASNYILNAHNFVMPNTRWVAVFTFSCPPSVETKCAYSSERIHLE